MLTRDLQLLIDLKIIGPRSDPQEAFFVWAKLMSDPVVEAASRAIDWHDLRYLKGDYQATHDAVAAMNSSEKQELAERVRAAYAQHWPMCVN